MVLGSDISYQADSVKGLQMMSLKAEPNISLQPS